ncbi:hypothetical protein J6590_053385 [Homalodisca vitripennis]|nr:hypothetical protein J6590_053385 [Homalodisca vitripennis]
MHDNDTRTNMCDVCMTVSQVSTTFTSICMQKVCAVYVNCTSTLWSYKLHNRLSTRTLQHRCALPMETP